MYSPLPELGHSSLTFSKIFWNASVYQEELLKMFERLDAEIETRGSHIKVKLVPLKTSFNTPDDSSIDQGTKLLTLLSKENGLTRDTVNKVRNFLLELGYYPEILRK